MEHGDGGENTEWLRRQFEKEGKTLPPELEPPELFGDLRPYWDAFWEISSGRNVGFAECGISESDILAYCELRGIRDLRWRRRLRSVVRFLDDEYLSFRAEHAKKKGGLQGHEKSREKPQIEPKRRRR